MVVDVWMEIVGMVVRCHSNSVMASQALSWTDEKMIVEIFSSKLEPRLPIRRPGERGEERRCRDGAMAL